jgi:ATP/ADP translocase
LGTSVTVLLAGFFPQVESFPAQRIIVAFYLAGGILLTVSIYAVWMLMTATVVNRSWMYFTIFGAFAQVGVIVSTHLSARLIDTWSLYRIEGLAGAGYLLAACLLTAASALFSCRGMGEKAAAELKLQMSTSTLKNLKQILHSPYTRLILLFMIFHAISSQALKWMIFKDVESAQTAAETAKALARFFGMSGYASLATQLALVPLAMRHLGAGKALIILPLFAAGSLLAIALGSPEMTLPIALACYISVEYTLDNCVREALFIPLPLVIKVKMKAVFSFIVPKMAAIAGSIYILYGSRITRVLWLVCLFGMIAIWGVLAARIARKYSQVADIPLEDERVSVDQV